MAQTVRNNFSLVVVAVFENLSGTIAFGETVEVSQSSFLKCPVFRGSSNRRGPNPDQNQRAMTLGTNRKFILP